MRKQIKYMVLLILLFILMGCERKEPIGRVKDNQAPTTNSKIEEPSKTQMNNTTSEDVNQDTSKNMKDSARENIENNTSEKTSNSKLDNTVKNKNGTIDEYFPFFINTESNYKGEGNEYASYVTYTDFIDSSKKVAQIRTNNGGTETVQVIQNINGVLSILLSKNECYYRDNLMNITKLQDGNKVQQTEILLKEPLVVGTSWKLLNGSSRYISKTDVLVKLSLGKFKALEVTTKEKDGITKDYYVKNMGLVKRIVQIGDMKVTSTLSKRNTEVPHRQFLHVYYVDKNVNSNKNEIDKVNMKSEEKQMTFYTNDITRTEIQKAMSEKIKKGSQPLIGKNTKINSLYLGKDNIVYIDFSKELVGDMNKKNLKDKEESLVIQGIVNTLGSYYGINKVCITVAGGNYESKNLKIKKTKILFVNIKS